MKMKIWTMALLAMMLVLPAAVQNASAQDGGKTKMDKKDDASKKKKQTFTLKSTKIEGERGGTDANIKDDSMINTAGAEFAGPKEKAGSGGTRGGAGVCKVMLDNRTQLKIKIYVDGSFRGVIAPFGDSVTYTGAGATTVYARAEFDDGSAVYWGPSNYTCYDGQYINFIMEK